MRWLAFLLLAAGFLGVPIHAKTKRKPPPPGWRIPYAWVEVPGDEETTLRGIWADRDGPAVVLLYGSAMGIRGVVPRILSTTAGSVMTATIRIFPPQSG